MSHPSDISGPQAAALPEDRQAEVVVTGIGAVTPAGSSLDEIWSGLCEGRSRAAPISQFDATGLPVTFACEVERCATAEMISRKDARRLDRFAQLGIAAALTAVEDANDQSLNPTRAAIVTGSGFGGAGALSQEAHSPSMREQTTVNPLFIPMLMPNALAAVIAMQLGWRGPNLTVSTACASSAHGCGEAARLIRSGAVDVALAGGAEAPITPLVIDGFARLRALSVRNCEPSRASRPFDQHRDGFVLGEGAAFFVLERASRAIARGAHIYASLRGYGATSDAYHLVAPRPDGAAAAEAMRAALSGGGVAPASVGLICAHGTSTPYNDAAEAEAVRTVFGESPPPLTAVKGALGHAIGAAGALGSLTACMVLAHGLIPPTANYQQGDDTDAAQCLDVVSERCRRTRPAPILVNAFGFGGQNASLLFTPWETGSTVGIEEPKR